MDFPSVKKCILRFRELHNHQERDLVQGKGKFDVFVELQNLPFEVKSTSNYICKECLNKLKKRRSLSSQLSELDSYLKKVHGNPSSTEPDLKRSAAENSGIVATPKKPRTVEGSEVQTLQTICTSTPTRRSAPGIPPKAWTVSPIQKQRIDQSVQSLGKTGETVVKKVDVSVKVKWPSKDTERKLPEDLEPLRKMLVRGTYKQIAHASWKNPSIRKELTELMARDIDKEVSQLCSKKERSCLRKTDKNSMLSFTMEKLSGEIRERAPLLHFLLSAACINPRSKAKKDSDRKDFGSVAMAAAVCSRIGPDT